MTSALKHVFVLLVVCVTAQLSSAQENQRAVEKWGIFELSLNGSKEGNPFVDVALSGQFRCGDRVLEVNGFYDGEGRYLIRFMPDVVGEWSYVTRSGERLLDGKRGNFRCQEP